MPGYSFTTTKKMGNNPNRTIRIVSTEDDQCSVSFTDSNVLLWTGGSPTQLSKAQAKKLGFLLLGFAVGKEENAET